jgi:antitoxin MazE
MSTTVKTRLVRIGNSQGIRIPKTVLEQLRFTEEIELEVLADQLIVRSAVAPRLGWESQFEQIAQQGDDQPLDEPLPTAWDEAEWAW